MRRLVVVPCPESWAAMQADADGRFCERCQLRVTDVAELDGDALDQWIAGAKQGRACGRFELDGGRLQTKLGLVASLLVTALVGCATPWPSSEQQAAQVAANRAAWAEFIAPDGTPEASGGQIAGAVRHSSSEVPLVGAIVILQSTSLPAVQERLTNEHGFYRFDDLPPGSYTIQVLAGHANVSKIAELAQDARFRAHFGVDPDQETEVMIGMLQSSPVSNSPSSTYSSRLLEYY